MKNFDLDYLFGWRYLLPVVRGDQFLLLGFSADELAFWKLVLIDATVTDDASKATVWLINQLSPACIAGLEITHLRSLCVVGSGKDIAAWHRWMGDRFEEVCDYALLPSSCSRVVVPLGKNDWVVQGLALHRPGRWLLRVIIALLKALARAGIDHPLRARMLCIAKKDIGTPSSRPDLAGLVLSSIGTPQSFALYLGTPNDNRKTVVLPLGDRSPSVILKVAETQKPKSALQNEARALIAMSMTSLAEQVPKLIGLDETDARLTLAQEFRQRHSVGRAHMSHAVGSFLAELSEIDRKQVGLADCLVRAGDSVCPKMGTCLSPAFVEVASSLYTRLRALANEGKQVCLHRSHGDFAPWNCVWTDRGLFVFDWEESRDQDLALGDAFYYVLSPFVHVYKNPDAGIALVTAIQFASDMVKRSGLCTDSAPHCETEVRVYLALWLLGRLKLSPFYGELAVRLERSWK